VVNYSLRRAREEAERFAIVAALDAAPTNKDAADLLQVSVRSLYYLMARYKLANRYDVRRKMRAGRIRKRKAVGNAGAVAGDSMNGPPGDHRTRAPTA